ncbi:MAG: PAS domain S-box protein, partial [Bacteroidales bacterium]|nr:PAS domain S-box protein [Bacteroidales bacterium]
MAEQLTGWRSRLAQGRPLAEVFRILSEDSRQPAVVPVAEVLASGASRGPTNHTVLVGSGGVERTIAHSAAPILGAEGEPLGVVLVFRDISEERAAERALEASEQRYRELIEHAPYGIFVQTGGCFAYLNPTAVRLLGARDQAELLGRPLLDFLHPENRDAVAERIRQLNLLGIPSASREEKWMRLDGSVFHAEATAAPHVHDGERGALVMLRDISARRAAEVQRDRFFDLSLDPQCILDASGRFLRVNAAFSEVLGWSEQEFLDKRYLDLIHPEERADAEREHGSIRTENAAQRLEVRFRRRIGDWRWLSWNAIADENGGLIYAVARDVTERRETIQALTRARQQAEYANRAKSAFLATMSHEIRTPMNAVVGLAEVLSHSALGEHDEELVRNISVSAGSLLRLIDDILDFSKIEAGRLELEQAPVAIEVIVEDLCQALLPMARERGVSLSAFVAPELPRHILGDDTRLRQLLNNLIGNAIKFSAAPRRQRGQVRIRVEPGGDGDTLELTVTDNGIGMSRDTLDHIFRPFTQGEPSTTRRYGGTGLGLAISKRLVDLMGGEIRLDSREGEGTTATVVLPLEPAGAVSGEDEQRVDLSGVNCVLVDTAELATSDWQRYLHSAGASATCVPTLEAALALDGDAGPPRVVILDLREPAHGALPVNTAFRGDDRTRFVLVDTGRRGVSRVQGGKMVILEGGALRRRQLLQAVAMAAGRAVAPGGDGVAEPVRPVAQPPVGGDHRILVVEDDDMNRKVIIEQLRLLGYTAEVAADGGSALALWRERHHGLILSDLHMPEMDGYDFVHALRSEERPPVHTPVIALTANAMHGEESRALARGFDDYLTKPVSLAALEAVLRHWLSPATGNRQSIGVESSVMAVPEIESLGTENAGVESQEAESPARRGDEAMAGSPATSMPVDTIPTETMPTETMPTETMPTETMPTETMPTETMPTEIMPTDSSSVLDLT